MIVAGIDEAGYGPILGPLVVGCCALELPDGDHADDIACGWKTLARIVKRTRDATGKRLHVNDSKKVYSPSAGVAELERSTLCFAAALRGEANTFDQLLQQTAHESLPALHTSSWYAAPTGEVWPFENESLALRLRVNAIRHELMKAKAGVRHFHAHVVPENRLNEMFELAGNKAATSFTFVASHIDRLLSTFADQSLVIYCDRQGGRERYGSLLMQLFPEWSLEVTSEQPGRAAYRLTQGERSARILFAEQAEQECMSVALASMLAKYLREASMRRFNAWWRSHLPDLKPTAGYYTDGLRFLEDIRAKCAELGIDPATLTRAR